MGQFPHTEPQSGLHEGVGGVILTSLGQTGSPVPHIKRTTFVFLWYIVYYEKKTKKKTLFQCFFRRSCFFRHKKQFFSKKTKVFFSNCITRSTSLRRLRSSAQVAAAPLSIVDLFLQVYPSETFNTQAVPNQTPTSAERKC